MHRLQKENNAASDQVEHGRDELVRRARVDLILRVNQVVQTQEKTTAEGRI